MIGKIFDAPERRLTGLVERAKQLSTATIAAAMGEPSGRDALVAQGALDRVSGEGVIAGHAITAWSPAGNNTMIRFGMESCEPGDILVIASPSVGSAQWGDLATAWSKARGIAGVIVYGSVRDIADVRKIGQNVWARNVDPRQAGKASLGYVNAPVLVGGLTINPGDLIVADDDAVLVLGPDEAESAVAAAEVRAEREAKLLEAVRTGAPASELMPMVPDVEPVSMTYDAWLASGAGE